MSFLVASHIMWGVGMILLAVVCIALARQIGVLHQRIAPAGALSLPQPLKLGGLTPQLDVVTLAGTALKIGGAQLGRSQLLLFMAPDCPVCAALLPALRSAHAAERKWLDMILAGDGERAAHEAFVRDKGLEKFPFVLSEELGRRYGVAKLPYAALIDEAGLLVSSGLVNTREHLESLFNAKETGTSSIQQYLQRRAARRASGES